MSYQANVVEIFIASPDDVKEERLLIRRVITEWNYSHSRTHRLVLSPVSWETHAFPMMGDRPQSIINKQILNDCDLLIAVFWSRLGTPTGAAASGSVEEIHRHVSAGKPAMVYFSSKPVTSEIEQSEDWARLARFKDACKEQGLIERYASPTELREKLSRHLYQAVAKHFLAAVQPSAGAGNAPTPTWGGIGRDALELLREAVAGNGTILRIGTRGGLHLQVNGKMIVQQGDPRSEARWTAALEELERKALVSATRWNRETFAVTHAGYTLIDHLDPETAPRAHPE